MAHIGLIGGIGPAATHVYHLGLIAAAQAAGRDLELTIAHADSATLLANLAADDQDAQCAIYHRLAQRLRATGAEAMAVTSIAGHFCLDRFAEIAPLPVIDLTAAVAAHVRDRGMARVGVLGTETVMRTAMYGKLAPAAVLAPEGAALSDVHAAYVTVAAQGHGDAALARVFTAAGADLVARGAEAVLLGGTDLNAVFPGGAAPFPTVDCAGVHIAAIAARL